MLKVPLDSKPTPAHETSSRVLALPPTDRRDLLKAMLASTAVAAGGACRPGTPTQESTAAGTPAPRLRVLQDFPVEVREDYKPFHQKDNCFMAALLRPELGLRDEIFQFHGPRKIDPDTPGFSQLDWALKEGGFALTEATTPGMPASIPGTGLNAWRQVTEDERGPFEFHYLSNKKYEFQSPRFASAAIKKAASLYGADLVGITRRDPRWDYAGFVDPIHKKTLSWDDFPFEPKTVIVLAFEMDYEAYTTAPSYVSEAATGVGYSRMSKSSYQLAVFLKLLGYQSVSTGNDVGLNIPYAVAAGLGEPSRMGPLITQKYGPRVRISKIYTDLDFVEYDRPIAFGALEFCKRCKRCAEACPVQAITHGDEPTFEPAHGGETFFNNPGVKKFYNNNLECFKYWLEIYAGCGACIASCPYSKPDFWHHRFVERITELAPGPLHEAMTEMDGWFGYGNTQDGAAASAFWNSG